MHRRNQSLDKLAGVISGVGGNRESSSGFSYGPTPPLTHPPTPAQQAKLQLEKQKYKERHQHLRGEFSQSAESLNSRDQDLALTPMSSTSALPTTNTNRTQTYGNQGSGRRDSSYFPPTPPASIRVASPAGTPRGHSHNGSQQSNISERGPTSRSSTPTSLNGLFPSNGSMAPTSAQGVQGGKKPRASAASSIRSRFTFSLIGGGGDKDKGHGRQGSVGGTVYANQMQQQQQQYLQHLLQEEERLQQEDAPLPPLPPPTSPAQRDREWADQLDRSSIRRRSVNSVHSNETDRRTPTSPEEARRGLGVVSTVGANPQRDFENGTHRSGSISTVRTHRTASIVYDQDVDMSRMEDLLGSNSPIEFDEGEDSDTSINSSLFRQNRKKLEGTGIATGESTMIGGNLVCVDGKLVRVNGSGSAMTIASIASTGTMRSIDNFPLLPSQQQFLNVEEGRDPISPLPSTSMQLPPSSPSSQKSVDNTLATTEQEPVKRSPSSSSTLSQVKRKPSPVTMSFPAAASLPGANTPSTPLPSVAEPDLSKPPTPPPQTPLPPPPIITTSEPNIPNNPITNITSPLRHNAGETAVPSAWGGRLQMEISQVELPPPPPHTRSPLGDSPLAVQYPVERKKKMIDEEWEDMEREDAGDGDAPPPPYVPRQSMLVHRNEEEEGEGMWEDEKAMLRRAAIMNGGGLPMKPPSRQSTFEEPTVEALNADNREDGVEERHDDTAIMRPPTTALPSDRADFESQRRRKGENEAPSSITNKRTMQRRTVATSIPTVSPITTKNRSNPNSTANSPTVGRKHTILKKPGATPKLSPGLARSNTRGKIRFSHVAPEVVIPPLPNSASLLVTEAAETGKGKQCKTCKQVKGGSLANKYRELLTRERENFSLERSIWEEERKGYDKKIADLEKRMRRLVEVLARGDEGGDDDENVEEAFDEHAVEEEEDEVEDAQPVMSATGGLSLGPPSANTRKNSFRDTGKEVDRSQMIQPSRDRTAGSWPRQTGLPTPPATGAIGSFNRPPATTDESPEGSGGAGQYWNNFLDDHRPSRASAGNYGYAASSSASSSSWGAASRTWNGASSSSSATTWDTGSHTHGGWKQEELDPRMGLPITEERAVYARLYAEASIGIGGPTGELLH